jgi:hypothetical protein
MPFLILTARLVGQVMAYTQIVLDMPLSQMKY